MEHSEFTARMRQIVLVLLDETKPLPVKQLADRIQISKRTVQRELEYIPRAVKRYGLVFGSKTGKGIWLDGSAEDKEALKQELKAEKTPDASDRSERQKRLTLEILKDKSLKKLYYYSDMFGVSEATISTDLEAVKGWFHDCRLEIRRKPGYGIFIEGSERDFRRALRQFIDENIHTEIIKEMYEDRNRTALNMIQNRSEHNIYRILDDDIINRVTVCILRIPDKRILNLTHDSYLGLVIHVAIAVNRIKMQEIIEENPQMTDMLRNDADFKLAELITDSLKTEFEIPIPEIETAYICLHIKGSKIQQLDIDDKSRSEIEESRELWDAVSEMVDCYDEGISYLLKQDEEFVIRGLIAHLKPTLVRLANGMSIQNPLLEQIKTDYSAIFERCKTVAKVIERRYGYEVPEPEIGFLAIHFGAAEVRLEGRKGNRRKVAIGIVCASGIGISRLMSSKIARDFADRIELASYGMGDLSPYILSRTDFFVSTMKLKEDADILYVSPLLPSEDMDRITRKVHQYEYMPAKVKEQEFTVQLDQVNFVAMQIKNIIRGLEYRKVDSGIGFDELLIAISEVLTPYADRREIIQEDLKARERLGSQIFPDFGFALFHARTAGIIKPSFLVCQTRQGTPFTNPYLKGTRAVLVMLVPKDEHVTQNSEILGILSERLIEEDSFLEAVLQKGKEEIRTYVSEYLNQYFKQYLDKI